MNKKLLIRVSKIFIVAIFLIALIGKVIADENDNSRITVRLNINDSYVDLNSNTTLFINGKFFRNNPIYCIESEKFYASGDYDVYDYKNVEPIGDNSALAYVLSLPHVYKTGGMGYINMSSKQKLIWYFLDGGPRKGNKKLLDSGCKAELQNAENFNNDDVKIELNTEQIGDYIKVEWNNPSRFTTGYDVYINENENQIKFNDEPYESNITSVNIPVSKFNGEKVYVKVIARGSKIKRTGYYLLRHHTSGERYRQQQLIISASEFEDVAADNIGTDIRLGDNISLQKYIIGTIGSGDNQTISYITTNGQDTNEQDSNLINTIIGNNETSIQVYEDEQIIHNNILMIGDSRTVGIYNSLVSEEEKANGIDILDKSITLGQDDKTKHVTFLAKNDGNYSTFFPYINTNSSNLYNLNKISAKLGELNNIENDSEKKSKCIFWFGKNDIIKEIEKSGINTDTENYVDVHRERIKNLVKKYCNVNIYRLIKSYNNVDFFYYGVGYVKNNCEISLQNGSEVSGRVFNQLVDIYNDTLKELLSNEDIPENEITSEKENVPPNLHYEEFNSKLIEGYGQREITDSNGNTTLTDIEESRSVGEIIKYGGTKSEIEDFNRVIWNQIFTEEFTKCIIKNVVVNAGETITQEAYTDTYEPTGRENRYAVNNNAKLFNTSTQYNHRDKQISNHKNRKNVKTDFNKIDRPVEIEAGDSVVYKIEVYNNRNMPVLATVSDDFSSMGGPEIKEIRTCLTGSYTDATRITNLTKTQYDEGDLNNNGVAYWHNEKNNFRFNLEGGATRYFYITIKYNAYTSEVIRNRAWISDTNESNSAEYRTIDADYVKMKEYRVSLEKFVNKVTDKNQNNEELYSTSRQGKRYNNQAQTDLEHNKNTYKPNNKVQLEIGDIVTYTIRLKNTGDTKVKISKIYDSFDTKTNGVKLTYLARYGIKGNGGGVIENDQYRGANNELSTQNLTNYLIKFDNAQLLNPGESTDVTMQFKVEVPEDSTNSVQVLQNTACIVELINKNTVTVVDGDGTDNNRDADYVQTKIYKVSLEKFVYKVNNREMCDIDGNDKIDIVDAELIEKYLAEYTLEPEIKDKIIKYGDVDGNGKIEIADAQKIRGYLAEYEGMNITREGYAEHNYDDDTTTNNYWKRNHVVTVSNGDMVTYKIKLRNDGNSNVYITEVKDFFPNGIIYDNRTFGGGQYDITEIVTQNEIKLRGNKINASLIMEPGTEKTFEVTVEVVEKNISLNILRNTATISQMKNRNGSFVKDTTPNDNTDSDYLQLDYSYNNSFFSGMVWIDKNQSKDNSQNGYNAQYQGNGETESKLAGIVVKLYRNGVNSAIATKTTDSNGYYYFKDKDIDKNVVKNAHERHLKGPMVSDTVTRWAGTYYAYRIEFEYDGITYTSTPDGKTCVSVTNSGAFSNKTYKINSNASENFNIRKEFNNKFNTINKDSLNNSEKIDYTTKNESGYIPKSQYNYKTFMKMKSSTETIQLSNSAVLEEEIKYINLGLRGRDIFDLELTSDVAQIDVTVNNIPQTYEFTNKVTVRKADLGPNTNITDDMLNIENEVSNEYVSEYNDDDGQKIRNTDKPYLNSVYVTYKITVQNTSKTLGTATYITNYYDDKYNFIGAYANLLDARGRINALDLHQTAKGTSDGGYRYRTIKTNWDRISQSETKDIYIVYKLKNISYLAQLEDNKKLATYNMAEIYEYKTFAKDNDNEYVRGLIDKDSAPGSALTEKVCLSEGNSNLSTVNYYFNKQNLSKLKYEDDTYATPTLYFVSDSNKRTLTGYVFEDSTRVINHVKSGDGIKGKDKNGNNEPGIKGVRVILNIPGSNNEYETTTDKDGKYTISGFIPGKDAILTYWYGDSDKTFCKATNGKSYNGEDFESANNSGISTKDNYWYIVNSNRKENAFSIATDIESDGSTEIGTRKGVSTRVSKYSDNKLEILNKARAGIITETVDNSEERKVREDTKMHSKSSKFLLTVEKAGENGAKTVNKVKTYEVSNMNFGIQEVPVTTLDLKSTVKELIIKDAAGDNTIASAIRELNNDGTWTGKWKITGNILAPGFDSNLVDANELKKMLDISIEEEKLQGAKLKIKYEITADQKIEKDFKENGETKAAITGLINYVDNDLSYSADSVIENNITNSKYWEVTTYDATQEEFKKALRARGETVSDDKKYGSIDPEGKIHTTILKANSQNPLLTETSNNVSCDLVLEKVLSAHDNTLSDIVASTVETYDYNNKIEITGLNYINSNYRIGETSITNADRIRTPKLEESSENYVTESWMTILPGINRFASSVSEDTAIHPPTGNNTMYNITVCLIIGVGLFTVLAVGVVLIKKYIIKMH